MKFVVTDGTSRDFAALCRELDRELIVLNGEQVQAVFSQFNGLEDIHDVLLACDGETAVAGAGFKAFDSTTVELKRVFVRPPYRRSGLARAIIHALEQRAQEQGYKAMLVETGKAMGNAQRLYRALGYTDTPNFPPYVGNPHSVCMKKILAAGHTIELTKQQE